MNTSLSVLVVDDDCEVAQGHASLLVSLGHQPTIETDPRKVESILRGRPFDLILLDMRMPRMDGLEVLRIAKLHSPHIGVIIATVVNDIELAVRAIKAGAYNYLLKPISLERLSAIIHSYLSNQPKSITTDPCFRSIVTSSPLFVEIFDRVRAFATADVPILVSGETGTGKDLIAQLIHSLSPRSQAPFVAVNCGAVPNEIFESEIFGHCRGAFTGAIRDRVGYIEAAHGGTLFIDEVGELGPEQQKKLLRVLQNKTFSRVGESTERTVHARFVFATNRRLHESVSEGTFRSDLYYRISGHTIDLPPLRLRGDDRATLAQYFFKKYCSQHGRILGRISPEALSIIQNYSFPGNVRELEGIISASVLLEQGPELSAAILPKYLSLQEATDEDLAAHGLSDLKYKAIITALSECNGNQTRAAARLGIARETLNRLLRKYRLSEIGVASSR